MRETPSQAREMYKEFDATELYCPNCKQAVQVRKRLLLVLPQGDKYEYLCIHCGESVGNKIDHTPPAGGRHPFAKS